jgi:hypothetical protein
MKEDLNELDRKKIVQYALKSGLIKTGVGTVDLTWEDLKQINVQLKNNPLGIRLRIEDDGTITPMLTFDTKKLKSKQNRTNDAIETALKNYEGYKQ